MGAFLADLFTAPVPAFAAVFFVAADLRAGVFFAAAFLAGFFLAGFLAM
jgi:hypothetical protein